MEEIVDIFDISYEGAGVGKIDGQIVFVPKTLPGEKVRVKIVKKTNSYLIGEVVEILRASEKRIALRCPYFSICGGCDFQHCDRDFEQEIKIQILKKELAKVGFDGELNFVSSPKRFAYRNKIKLEVLGEKLGYFKAKSHQFFEVKTCPIASERIANAFLKVKRFLEENKFQGLKNVYFKEVGERIAICFLFAKNCEKMQKNAKNLQILSDFSVFFAFGDVLESNETKVFHVLGEEKLFKDFGVFKAEIEPSAFNQINDDVAGEMYEFVTCKTADKRVVNAYSGQGLLTRLISQNAKFVYGIEYQKSAHKSAEKLTADIQNVENICGRVEEKLSEVLLRDFVDIIVLDPAREGCKKDALDAILNGKIKEIIYISCNFSTLVRDLRILREKYTIESVTLFDMFPCTAGMETVVYLRAI